jgi:FkbH-like protein
LFIDDNPVERERVRQRLPEVEVWGEDIFGLRRRLLNDPRLQTPRLVAGSFDRTERTKGQLERQAARARTLSDVGFLVSLNLETKIVAADETFESERIAELFERTTQFNATGRKFPIAVLEALLASPDGHIFVAYAKDRFADHGLIGAAVVEKGEIRGFAISCRVLGLGIEHKLLGHIVENVGEPIALKAAIIPTDRNLPVRNLYRDNGFLLAEDGLWHFADPSKAPAPGPALGVVGK